MHGNVNAPHTRVGGFTLIELMAVVAIVAILAAIAIPNYAAYVQRGNRAEARATLLDASTWMQRRFTENNTYPASLPGSLTQVPAAGTARYNLSVAAAGTTYTLAASPSGTMAGDDCGVLTIDNLGTRGAKATVGTGGQGQVTVAGIDTSATTLRSCWGR